MGVNAVMISIQPVQVEKILNRIQTVIVRKSRPKLQAPFKCYIYCTKGGGYYKHIYVNEKDARNKYRVADHWGKKQQIVEVNGSKNNPDNFLAYECYLAEGKVVAEFTCDAIFPISIEYSDPNSRIALKEFPYTGMTDKQIMDYLGNGAAGYGWHISDLVVYDEPKELSEFKDTNINCKIGGGRGCSIHKCGGYVTCLERKLKRPPQSWCYVEPLK